MAYNVSRKRILLVVVYAGGLCGGSMLNGAAFREESLLRECGGGRSNIHEISEHMPLEQMQGLHDALNPDYRDWSVVNGMVAHTSGFLADFFKNHQVIELVARHEQIPLSEALKQEEFGYFYHEHFNLLKHLFYQQEQERSVQLAQGSKTFAHQVARCALSDEDFARIMGDVVAYGIKYDEVLQKNKGLVDAIKAIQAMACCVEKDHGPEVLLLQEHAEHERRLSKKKAAEFNVIREEFRAKIVGADQKERLKIIAQKKQKELEVVQKFYMQKEIVVHRVDMKSALQFVNNVRQSLNKSVHACVKKYVKQGGEQSKLCDRIKSAVDGIVLHDPAQELQALQGLLRMVMRSKLDLLRDGVVAKFDKKSAEHVRNFLHVLESALLQETAGLDGLAARMVMAFVYEAGAKKQAVIDLYNRVSQYIPCFLAYPEKLFDGDFASATDLSLATCIADAAIMKVKDVELWYEQLVYELLMYAGRCHITHPHARYKKTSLAIKSKIDAVDGVGSAESKEVVACFSDCTETALRNFMSELISNGTEFDLSALDALGVLSDVKTYFTTCCATYQEAHTQRARHEWTQLLTGRPGLIYKQDAYKCEVKAGIKNFLHALVQFFELKGLPKNSFDTFTGNDIGALFMHLCGIANTCFRGVKKICLDSIVILSGDERLLPSQIIEDDEKVRMKLEFLVTKNDEIEKIVLTVMDGHAEFDVHKITKQGKSVGQKALNQLIPFLYTSSGEHNSVRNALLDLLTQLGLQSSVQRVRESADYKYTQDIAYSPEEKILDMAGYLLSFIAAPEDVQHAIQYLQAID